MQTAFARKWLKWGAFCAAVLLCVAIVGVVIHANNLCSGGPFSGYNQGQPRPWSCAYVPDWLGALTGNAGILLLFFWWTIIPILVGIWLLPAAVSELIGRRHQAITRSRKD